MAIKPTAKRKTKPRRKPTSSAARRRGKNPLIGPDLPMTYWRSAGSAARREGLTQEQAVRDIAGELVDYPAMYVSRAKLSIRNGWNAARKTNPRRAKKRTTKKVRGAGGTKVLSRGRAKRTTRSNPASPLRYQVAFTKDGHTERFEYDDIRTARSYIKDMKNWGYRVTITDRQRKKKPVKRAANPAPRKVKGAAWFSIAGKSKARIVKRGGRAYMEVQ